MALPSKESARFVFHGTVKRLKAANVKSIAGSERTAVVTVNKIVRAPSALAGLVGRDVTVRLADGERIRKGQQAVFHTNSLIFGENMAVQSLGHDPIARAPAGAAAAVSVEDPVRAATHQKIRERASEAPVAVTGTIVAVGLPGTAATQAAAAVPGAAAPRQRISEHEPFWREAVVEVHAVHKGAVGKQQVVLRFPSSTDVRWHRAPKFETGQQGVFFLRPDEVSGHTTVGLTAASFAADTAFTCLHSADFQPSDHEAEVAIAVSAATN